MFTSFSLIIKKAVQICFKIGTILLAGKEEQLQKGWDDRSTTLLNEFFHNLEN